MKVRLGPAGLPSYAELESAVESMAGSADTSSWSDSWSGPTTAFTYTYAQASGTAPMEVTLTIDNSLVMGEGVAFEQSAFKQALAQKCATALSIDVSEVKVVSTSQLEANGVTAVVEVGPAGLTFEALEVGMDAVGQGGQGGSK